MSMNKLLGQFLMVSSLLISFVACTSAEAEGRAESLADCVNPFIGTDFTGNTYPGAQVPFGMVQLSPDNGLPGWDRIAGYFWPDSTIAGFSHTHLSGTGAGDLYDISFMPVTLPYREAKGSLGIHSRFSHDDESASAGYYQVRLADYDINVELTATSRCGVQRYTFPKADAVVFLNLRKAMNWDATQDAHIEQVDSVTLRGYRFSNGWARGQRVFFCTRFSRPFDKMSLDTEAIMSGGKQIGTSVIARLDFKTEEGEQLVVSTALSGVSMEGAMRNLQVEMPDNDFDKCLASARKDWDEQLGKIEIECGNRDEKVKFYTALYHAMLAPTLYSDVDGAYYGPDKQVHRAEGWTNYSTFSLWDTFRAAHPLFTYVAPERVNDMVKSFIAFYEQNGRLPVWNMWGSETDMMIGYHAVAVIADAYLKGIGDFDAEKALEACVATANLDDYRGIGAYKELGYVPCNLKDPYNADDWSLSKTLEYAYDDYCIARMAEKMGRKDVADEFYKRSQNYRNVYNPQTGFMQPRDDKGNFVEPFSPDDYMPHICESNGWQYFWSVQHDVDGLMELAGGKERFAQKLDSMFTYHPGEDDELPIFSTGMIGQYAHGNEPSHHVIYLFNAVGQPWKTQHYAARVMHELYLNTPAGLCGNEDCGQMSAWYVFSAMGFYPVDPVSGRYEIGSPLYPEVRMRLPNGKTFTVRANGVSQENCYIRSMTFNGAPYDKTYITHEQILSGGVLEFEMSAECAYSPAR
ncbi:MAG TPA: GH92 family glycosyl hydrolase [Candidatus Bacteroides pullicola]|uniref:GH92 family glycosyl hydrolase n=1 Tax=Candidatus Bacteroides pullicola TaxID=2838475 RepID=A0A9D1ZJG9_9BACE|nr:GH92 family glycosyl hydrolase [Candidatus Bacteroides pullicola]